MNPHVCKDCIALLRERDDLKSLLEEAVSYLRQGKAKFAPNTTNSHVDIFLARFALRGVKESNPPDHRAGAEEHSHGK